jgi:hypothetical protein
VILDQGRFLTTTKCRVQIAINTVETIIIYLVIVMIYLVQTYEVK